MWLRLAAVSDVGRINRTVQGYYRVHPNSMMRTVNAGLLTDLIGRRDAFISALPAVTRQLGKAADLEAAVRQRLAEEALESARYALYRNRMDLPPWITSRVCDGYLPCVPHFARLAQLATTSTTRAAKQLGA